MNRNQTIGQFGEQTVCNYLIKKGYKIKERNYKTSYKELDIIAEQGDEIVFIEVKTRTSTDFGDGTEAAGYYKQRNLKSAISRYLYDKHLWHREPRCDLVLVFIDKKKKSAKITHYKDIL